MAIKFVITTAGRAALVNAGNTGTLPVLIAQVGVTATAFTASASATTVPGELKRLATFGGAAVAADTIHTVIRDDSADVYTLRGFGLYLDDGTLFGLYGQAGAIMEKSAAAMMVMATDVIFADIDAASVSFGATSFLNPPATVDTPGVLELATDAEAIAGVDAVRAVTPKGLLAKLTALLGSGAPSAFVKSLLTAVDLVAFRSLLAIKTSASYDIGVGNGLDADMLDGQHGAYYRAYSNLTGVPLTFAPAAHNHSAADITSGTLTVARGGTGASSFTAGSYLIGNGSGALALKTPTQVRTNIGAAATQHSHNWSDINDPPVQTQRWPTWYEVGNKPTLGTAAAKNVTDFATAAQGAKAESAIQPGDVRGTLLVPNESQTLIDGSGNWAGIRGAGAGHAVNKLYSNDAKDSWVFVSSSTGDGTLEPDTVAARLYRDGRVVFAGSVEAANIGSAAAKSVDYFATKTQGAKADSAVQPDDIGSAAEKDVSDFAGLKSNTFTGNQIMPGLFAGVPVDFWTGSPAAFLGNAGYLGTNGAFALSLRSNGYRNASGGWTSLGLNGSSAGSGIDMLPAGQVVIYAGIPSGTDLPSVAVFDAGSIQLKKNTTVAGTIAATNLAGTNTGDQDLSGLAPKASPTFTGAPKAPTAAPGSNTTQLATTAFVQAAITAALADYLPKNNPTFTGVMTGPSYNET